MNINIKSSKCLRCKCMKSGTYKNYEKNIIMSNTQMKKKNKKIIKVKKLGSNH